MLFGLAKAFRGLPLVGLVLTAACGAGTEVVVEGQPKVGFESFTSGLCDYVGIDDLVSRTKDAERREIAENCLAKWIAEKYAVEGVDDTGRVVAPLQWARTTIVPADAVIKGDSELDDYWTRAGLFGGLDPKVPLRVVMVYSKKPMFAGTGLAREAMHASKLVLFTYPIDQFDRSGHTIPASDEQVDQLLGIFGVTPAE